MVSLALQLFRVGSCSVSSIEFELQHVRRTSNSVFNTVSAEFNDVIFTGGKCVRPAVMKFSDMYCEQTARRRRRLPIFDQFFDVLNVRFESQWFEPGTLCYRQHRKWPCNWHIYIWPGPFLRSRSRLCTSRQRTSLKWTQIGLTLLLPANLMSHVGFRLVYLDLILACFKGQLGL